MPAYLVVRAVVAETDRRDFDHWYRTEHLPDAMKAFDAQSAWRGWSRTDPSVHYAYLPVRRRSPRQKPSARRRRSAR